GFVDGKRLVSQRVEVKLGIRRPGRVEITEGLGENDTVIIAGQQRVQRDNTPVRVIELGRPPAGAGAASGAPSQSLGQSAGGGCRWGCRRSASSLSASQWIDGSTRNVDVIRPAPLNF
ncbi:MAG: hypothetical protein HC765_11680, partial [Brachymonas sp.]|nr:hypothetical protein [Brachymonas sp.]